MDSVLPTGKTGEPGSDVIVDCNFAATLTTVLTADIRTLAILPSQNRLCHNAIDIVYTAW
jgi:hypothetical protein